MTGRMVWALLIVVLAIQISLSVPALAQQKPEELAEQSSGTWLSLNDSGKYADSYDQKLLHILKMPSRAISGSSQCMPCAIR